MTHEEIYKAFHKWSPGHGRLCTDYKPWGSSSIIVRLQGGLKYKVKHHGGKVFTMQVISDEDIEKKLGKVIWQ